MDDKLLQEIRDVLLFDELEYFDVVNGSGTVVMRMAYPKSARMASGGLCAPTKVEYVIEDAADPQETAHRVRDLL